MHPEPETGITLPDNANVPTGIDAVSPAANLVQTLKLQWASVPLDSEEAEILLMASAGQTSLDTEAVVGKVLRVVAWMVREQDWVDAKTGEVRTGPTSVLLTEDGETYSSGTKGVLEGLSIMAARRPRGRYDPPIEVVMRRVKTAAGLPRHILARHVATPPPKLHKGAKDGK